MCISYKCAGHHAAATRARDRSGSCPLAAACGVPPCLQLDGNEGLRTARPGTARIGAPCLRRGNAATERFHTHAPTRRHHHLGKSMVLRVQALVKAATRLAMGLVVTTLHTETQIATAPAVTATVVTPRTQLVPAPTAPTVTKIATATVQQLQPAATLVVVLPQATTVMMNHCPTALWMPILIVTAEHPQEAVHSRRTPCRVTRVACHLQRVRS